jgi:hypothetical protein
MKRLTLCALVALLLVVSPACSKGRLGVLPKQVAGFWTTSDVRYRGRFMEFSPAYVIIGAGKHGSPTVQIVDRVDAQQQNGETVYTIYSTSPAGMTDRLVFRFRPENGGEIRLENQANTVWTRCKTDDCEAARSGE